MQVVFLNKPEIIEIVPITSSELKEELKRIKKRDTELNFRSNKTSEYLENFKLIKHSDVAKLTEKLQSLNVSRLRDEQIVKIIDLMPTSVEDLKVILSGYNISLPNDVSEKIVAVVKEFI